MLCVGRDGDSMRLPGPYRISNPDPALAPRGGVCVGGVFAGAGQRLCLVLEGKHVTAARATAFPGGAKGAPRSPLHPPGSQPRGRGEVCRAAAGCEVWPALEMITTRPGGRRSCPACGAPRVLGRDGTDGGGTGPGAFKELEASGKREGVDPWEEWTNVAMNGWVRPRYHPRGLWLCRAAMSPGPAWPLPDPLPGQGLVVLMVGADKEPAGRPYCSAGSEPRAGGA